MADSGAGVSVAGELSFSEPRLPPAAQQPVGGGKLRGPGPQQDSREADGHFRFGKVSLAGSMRRCADNLLHRVDRAVFPLIKRLVELTEAVENFFEAAGDGDVRYRRPLMIARNGFVQIESGSDLPTALVEAGQHPRGFRPRRIAGEQRAVLLQDARIVFPPAGGRLVVVRLSQGIGRQQMRLGRPGILRKQLSQFEQVGGGVFPAPGFDLDRRAREPEMKGQLGAALAVRFGCCFPIAFDRLVRAPAAEGRLRPGSQCGQLGPIRFGIFKLMHHNGGAIGPIPADVAAKATFLLLERLPEFLRQRRIGGRLSRLPLGNRQLNLKQRQLARERAPIPRGLPRAMSRPP